MAQSDGKSLKMIAPGDISPNPENPRLIFRQEEMESLMLSIDQYGIQVPITVYLDGGRYYLLDGERRWRCAGKLGLRAIPAIVQAKPTELQNLVLMYNIHALREQWDYYTIASKLERVIDLFFAENGEYPNEVTLSEMTGLTRGAIRRCQLLINLPDRFKDLLLGELEKPKLQQKLSEDFFIEMERSLKTVVKRVPEYESRLDEIRDGLLAKFQRGTISAVTDFRQLSKIATALDNLDVKRGQTRKIIGEIFDPNNNLSIREAYERSVAFEYEERKYFRYVEDIEGFIIEVLEEERADDLDDDLVESLKKLHGTLSRLLAG
ncbi:ParB/RepB/Spo0J family partition protein [Aurantiacibacter spongiae]|uniref:ParB/RepB/Spo0J family partition protein n=1 Tax=Aurantiacibacter spongiae TaxID=2488860 RepID=A0A3N5DBL0_9SPHN|nr:ParB/RepB/Spo0J family partition protein [Aurantiacibacter spongiae]RPF72148.1 ParB/RepB/Spo0J family partition protein [Aurantiacibacter spongiae]